jgi:hypothetical protein|tara:strand:+ start:27 stop:314 length:288 start_codon:yes stop_codon:yes gene_type:complete
MDKRKNNGGNSTKSKEGTIDKRKNEYKDALSEASSKQDVIDVIKMIRDKAMDDKDIPAAKIFLEYYLGKPKDSLDVTTNGDSVNIPLINFTTNNE